MNPRRSVVLVYYREPEYLETVIEGLRHEFPDTTATEIIVVDNNSRDGAQSNIVTKYPHVRWVSSDSNQYYGGGNNLGASVATGEWLLIMNLDVVWLKGQLQAFVEKVEASSEISFAVPVLQYADGRVQISAHKSFPSLMSVFVDYCLPLQYLGMKIGLHPMQYSADQHTEGKKKHVTGVCYYLRRSVFLQHGGFDDRYAMYLEETDFQRRLFADGISPYMMPTLRLTHFGSAKKTWAQANPLFLRSLQLYAKRWWGLSSQALLWPIVWVSAIISLVTLLIAFVPSMIFPGSHQRVHHYLRAYTMLIQHLIRRP